jgi:integrase
MGRSPNTSDRGVTSSRLPNTVTRWGEDSRCGGRSRARPWPPKGREQCNPPPSLPHHGTSANKLTTPFETVQHTQYSPRRIQQIIKETASDAQITKWVYPHLLRHSVATTLLERGMPIEQIQKFLGHAKLETTQIYAESSAEMIKESYQRAMAG